MKNQRLSWLLPTISFLLLAGCSLQTPTPAPTPPPPTTSPSSPVATAPPTAELQPMITTLGLWIPEEMDPYGEGPAADVLAEQLTSFSQTNPNLQVDVTIKKASGRGGLLDFLRTAKTAAPSLLPDLIILDAAELETAAKAGLVQPLDPLLAPAQVTDRFPFATGLGSVDDQTLGFVVGAQVQHLAYRPSLFESPPVSWTNVISPPIPFLFPAGGRDGEINDATLIQYLASGGQMVDTNGNPWLDEEILVSVLGFYSDCIGTKTISPTVVLDITDSAQSWERFQAGEGGMAVVPSRRYWLEVDPQDETIAAASIPTQGGQAFTVARGWVVAMVTADSTRQEPATTLLHWLIEPEHSAQWTQAAGYLPSTRGALRLWELPDEERTVLRNVLEGAVAAPSGQAQEKTGRAIQEAVVAVLRRRIPPEEAAAGAADILGQ